MTTMALSFLFLFLFLFLFPTLSRANEITFILGGREEMCFHEHVLRNVKCILEFQVIDGRNYDIDVTVKAQPTGKRIYAGLKRQKERVEWTTEKRGVYQFCFSNRFSAFQHKTVYFALQVGDVVNIWKDKEGFDAKNVEDQILTATVMETVANATHRNLVSVLNDQKHLNLRERHHRSFAEKLNERVLRWSIFQTIVLVVVAVGQTHLLKGLITKTRPCQNDNRPGYGVSAGFGSEGKYQNDFIVGGL